jgi:ligand-binding SRPBCC domain-containing protein
LEYDLSDQMQLQPIIVDKSEEVSEQSNNIEMVFQINCVFPDTNPVAKTNGGCNNHNDFKDVQIEHPMLWALSADRASNAMGFRAQRAFIYQ